MVGRGRDGLILFLAANPCGMSRLALDQECAAIERELRLAAHAGTLAFMAKWAVTADEMMRHLIELQPTVIHFSGHGGRRATQSRSRARRDTGSAAHDGNGIYLQGDDGSPQLVDGRGLMKVIRSAASLARIVVLNACYSEAQAVAVSGVVDCVVGMTGEIDDDAARSFAVGFYRALGNGRSVANAIDQATAILAVKHPAYEHLPCYRTRDGIDATRLALRAGGAAGAGTVTAPAESSDERWTQRFEAVVNLCREAHERLDSDPLSAALRAQLAIGHVADYLQERELGPADPGEALDAKLRRVEAEIDFPPMVATHFESVRVHTSSMIDIARMAVGPPPSFLGPCLDSLAIVVEWFLWEYLDAAREARGAPAAAPCPAATGAADSPPVLPGPPRRRRRAPAPHRRVKPSLGRRSA